MTSLKIVIKTSWSHQLDLFYPVSCFFNTQVFFKGLKMTVAGIFEECSFNFFIIIVFAFLLDCWISFSKSDKLSVFPDIFGRRLIASRSKIAAFLSWNHKWNQIMHTFINYFTFIWRLGDLLCYMIYICVSIYMKFNRIYVRICSSVRITVVKFTL